jgi:hypothetical protein
MEGNTTVIEGQFVDHSALYGLLARIGEDGLRLIEVTQIQGKEDEPMD